MAMSRRSAENMKFLVKRFVSSGASGGAICMRTKVRGDGRPRLRPIQPCNEVSFERGAVAMDGFSEAIVKPQCLLEADC